MLSNVGGVHISDQVRSISPDRFVCRPRTSPLASVRSTFSPDACAHGWTTQQQNAHVTEQREVLYRWHPWHGRTVSIVGAMVRGGVAIFRCRSDDSGRTLEVPQWMFDAVACCRTQLAPQAIVACRALYDLHGLIRAAERIPSTPVLQAEHLIPHFTGGAHATHGSKDAERAAAAVPADGPS
jgi:hypothetical protein